jgi:hypothetical protein
MATPLQIARQRKIIYFAAIVVLFTISLIHREWIVKPQAFALQLREVSRGEVELTGSTVRLMLTGSRGLATTLLWYQAMEKQKRNEWHELELLVQSITKLQPYFITPWLYQSWNISFNVAVECDRPRDKYYYISRGLELLSEGERRNRGVGDENAADDGKTIVFPGHPEMRHYMGFTYQLKMGTSDERLTMRSLLELSCIDPIERNPSRFLTTNESGQEIVKLAEFEKFCQSHPRLVRRLREQLTYSEPKDIVRFLKDHEKIPSRFKLESKANATESELKEPLQQFPILPPPERHWPNSGDREMTKTESVDVYLICRTWYEFAQKPLPPPDPDPGENAKDYDKLRYRVPRQMVTQLFRQYPARAQVYIAETLESEGWFDSDGWYIDKWFSDMPNRADGDDVVVGREAKYHSSRAWRAGYEAYKEFGIQNGIYLTAAQIKDLNEKAALFRKVAKVSEGAAPQLRPEWRVGEIGASYDAHTKLRMSDYYRRLTNFDTFYYQAEAEWDPLMVLTRKYLYRAELTRKYGVPSELMLRDYENAWALYLLACIKYPQFAQVSSMQEDFYETYQRYLGETQKVHRGTFERKALQFAKLPFGPVPNEVVDLSQDQIVQLAGDLAYFLMPTWREAIARHVAITTKESDQQTMSTVGKMRNRMGALDHVHYYDAPGAKEVRECLFLWTQGASLAPTISVAPTAGVLASTISFPGHHYLYLTRQVGNADTEPATNWRRLITDETRRITADRLGLNR